MRRVIQTLSLALTSLFLLALPALAAEEHSTSSSEGFGSGQWDGLLLAAVFGVIMGIVLFVDAYAGSRDEGHDTHAH